MLLKKVTWYKYANINKAIRKPPIMTNMPFEKKKKGFCTFCLRNLNVEKEFVTCCEAEEVSSALFYIYLLC